MGTRGFTSINKLTGGFAGLGLKVLGVAAAAETLIDSFTSFAKREEQIVRASNATGASVERIAEAYEKAEDAARRFGIAPEDARKGVDALNTALGGIGKAEPQYELLIRTTAALGTTTEETAAIIKSAVNDLKIPTQDLTAFFDKVQKGAEGGALKSKGLAQTLAGVGQQASALYGGQVGPKAQGQLIGLAESIAKSAPEAEVPGIIEEFLNISGGKKPEKLFERETGINLGREAQKAAKRRRLEQEAGREGQDPLESFLDTVERGREKLHKQKPDIPINQLTNRLFASPSMRRAVNDMLEDRESIKAARDRPAAEEAGAVAKAAEKDVATTAAKVRSAKGYWDKAKEAIGGFVAHPLDALQGLPTQATPTPDALKRPDLVQKGVAPKKTWGEWFNQFNPISAAGAAEMPNGGMSSSMPSTARPLIPSAPGTATERTAREQLEAIRRLERIHMWGGGLRGAGGLSGSSGASPGGVSPGGGGGGGESPAPTWGSVIGPHHDQRAILGGMGGRRGGGVTPGGRPGGSSQGNTPGGAEGGARAVARSKKDQSADAALIRQLAIEEGVDPDTAVAVARSEGLGTSWAGGDKGSSFGPLQAHFGGMARGMMSKGQGDVMAAQGIDAKNPANKEAVLRWQLRYAKKHGWGEWYGAARVGIGRRQGLDGQAHPATAAARQHTSALSEGEQGKQSYDEMFKSTLHRQMNEDRREHPEGPSGVPSNPSNFKVAQLEDLRLKAAEPVRVKVAYDFDAADVRTHSRAYARRSFNKEVRDSRYSSYTNMGTPT